MICCSKFIHVDNDHLVSNNVMAHVVNIIHNHVVPKVAANDCTIVKTYGQPDIMKG